MMIDGLLLLAALLGVGAAAFLVARSPTFWIGLGKALFMAVLPIIMKRKTPEEEAAWRDEIKSGGDGIKRKNKGSTNK